MPIRYWVLMPLLLVLALPAHTYPAHEADYLFWPEMPEAARVAADMKGDDDAETAARRHAAAYLMNQLVNVSADGRKKLPWPPRERQLFHDYGALMGEALKLGKREAVFKDAVALRTDPAFSKALFERYFSAAALRELQPVVANWPQNARREQNLMNKQANAEAATRATWAAEDRAAVAGWRDEHPIYAWVWSHYWQLLGGSLLLSALGLAAMLRRRGISRDDPSLLCIGMKRYRLVRVFGEVMSASTVDKASVTTSGGTGSTVVGNTVYVDPVRVHTTQWQEQRFFLREASGREHDIAVVDAGLGLRPGHRLSALQAMKPDGAWGYWVGFFNHNTNLLSWYERGLAPTLFVFNWACLPMTALGAMLGLTVTRTRPPDWEWGVGGGAVAGLLLGIALGAVLSRLALKRFKQGASAILKGAT